MPLRIDIHSHNFMCSKFDHRTKRILLGFAGHVSQVDWIKNPDYSPHGPDRRKRIRKIIKTFGALRRDRTEMRFHINHYDDFMQHVKANGLWDKDIKVVDHRKTMYTPESANFTIIDGKKPYQGQIPKIEYLKRNDLNSKILISQTGSGKSLMASRALQDISERIFMGLTRKTYSEKWLEDFKKIFLLYDEDMITINGASDLKEVVRQGRQKELEAKIIICSMKTLQTFFKDYEEGEDVIEKYGCLPGDLMEVLGIGVRFIDEVHEHFHTVFKWDLYTHCPQTMNLTATMIDDNPFVEKMMWVMFPKWTRPPVTDYDRYIESVAYGYGFSEFGERHLHYIQYGLGSYSHIMYEKSLLKNQRCLNKYFELTQHVASNEFFSVKEQGQKLIIYCSMVKMCDRLAQYFAKEYPHLVVKSYTSKDDYENLMSADIIVSTPLSAGTAVDIPNLRTVIMTVSISSRRQNAQMLGRLRHLLKYPGTTPTFAYLVNRDIDKQVDYHRKKVILFNELTKHQREENTSYKV